MPALLSSAYFAPIQWYQKLNRYDVCLIEQHDHFVKQTYRNRCVIATANGMQTLSIPVEKFDDVKCEMKDVCISDHDNWRHQHWNALLSAYGESPFFEYYQDDIRPFYEKKWKFLFDFNMEITHTLCELLDIQSDIRPTEEQNRRNRSALCRFQGGDTSETLARRCRFRAQTLLSGVRAKDRFSAQSQHSRPAFQYGQRIHILSLVCCLFTFVYYFYK